MLFSAILSGTKASGYVTFLILYPIGTGKEGINFTQVEVSFQIMSSNLGHFVRIWMGLSALPKTLGWVASYANCTSCRKF